MVSHRFRMNPINTIHLDLVVKTAYEISIVFFYIFITAKYSHNLCQLTSCFYKL